MNLFPVEIGDYTYTKPTVYQIQDISRYVLNSLDSSGVRTNIVVDVGEMVGDNKIHCHSFNDNPTTTQKVDAMSLVVLFHTLKLA